ncbi:MAG: ATP-dependent Clp protease adapter ClpS [Campylobacterales bacterium]|nr:ATP-dependent Clp protease adapter ClpS [Campylobacterales bacterium]
MATKLENELKNNTYEELKEPSKYVVILLNDDFTSMDFVIGILMKIFHKSYESAIDIMIKVHKEGRGVCGVYTKEIAETKITQVKKEARAHGFPLRAVMEELS